MMTSTLSLNSNLLLLPLLSFTSSESPQIFVLSTTDDGPLFSNKEINRKRSEVML